MFHYDPAQDVTTAKTDLIVNTVNTVGVMGAGVALAFKKRFPHIMVPYTDACSTGRLTPGNLQLLPLEDGRTIVNFATKEDWRQDSKPEWVGGGMLLLARLLELRAEKYHSLTLPPPGCGHGGLDWTRVHQMAQVFLGERARRGVEITLTRDRPSAITDDPTFVAGIGARDTPDPVLHLMREIGAHFGDEGWRLRSGGARGADSAFGDGARAGGDPGEIFLTRPRADLPGAITDIRPIHIKIAYAFHPNPDALRAKGEGAVALMARNTCQLFGADMTIASRLVIAWTKDGEIVGGTGQALRMAQTTGIPVLNLGRPDLQGIGADDIIAMGREMIAQREAALGIKIPVPADPLPAP